VAENRWLVAVVAATLLHAAPPGCATTQPKSALYEKVGHGDLTLGALRVIIRDCARRFPAVLEVAATTLEEGPTTAEQRRSLLEFKANGVPMVQSVLLQQDPVAALLDGWALLYQLRDYLVRGSMDRPALPETVRTVEGLADELAGVWVSLTGRPDVTPARARVEAWARAHPLKGSLLARDATAPLLSSLLGRERLSLRGAAGTAVESIQDAITRIDLLALNMPRQARWQAEAAVQDLATSTEVGSVAASFDRALDRAFDLAEPLSELAAQTSAIISRERVAALADVDRERAALEAFLRAERRALMVDLAAERDATLQQVDGIAHGLVDRTFDRLQRLVLLTAVVLALVVAAAFLAWLLLSRARRRAVPRRQQPWPVTE
jgi:hypothetical protein